MTPDLLELLQELKRLNRALPDAGQTHAFCHVQGYNKALEDVQVWIENRLDEMLEDLRKWEEERP